MKAKGSFAKAPLWMGIALALVVGQSGAQQPGEETGSLPAPDELNALNVIESDQLAGLSGRDSHSNLTNVQSIQELDASVSNSAYNVDTMVTGAITIEPNSLNHYSGIVNIMTGNNNAVDAAMGVSIYLSE